LQTGWRCFPDAERVPLIGGPLVKIKNSLHACIPAIVQEIFLRLAGFFANILLNAALCACGGKASSPNLCSPCDSSPFENFDKLVSGMFESPFVHHSSIFINWQLNQETTAAYGYTGQPGMNLLPPSSIGEETFSQNIKSRLKSVYLHSI
jgi:hypothetical protein